jgi:hypothetical protein
MLTSLKETLWLQSGASIDMLAAYGAIMIGVCMLLQSLSTYGANSLMQIVSNSDATTSLFNIRYSLYFGKMDL